MEAIAKLVTVDVVNLGKVLPDGQGYTMGNMRFYGIEYRDGKGGKKLVKPKVMFAVHHEIRVLDKVVRLSDGYIRVADKDLVEATEEHGFRRLIGKLNPREKWIEDGNTVDVMLSFFWHSGMELEEINYMEEEHGVENRGTPAEYLAVKCTQCGFHHE